MNPPRISIAMATYNGEKYLQEQLDSIAAQTLPPYELVICDDGSTDATLDIAEKFATEAKFPVRIYRNEINLGYADNFLKVASLCEGDWVAFCDQDDIWFKNKLEVVSSKIKKHQNTTFVMHSARLIDELGRDLGRNQPDIKKNKIIEPLKIRLSLIVSGFSVIIKSDIAKLLDQKSRPKWINGENISHDWWSYILANAIGDVLLIKDILVQYRRHVGSITGDYSNQNKIMDKLRSGCAYCASLSKFTTMLSNYFYSSSQNCKNDEYKRKMENASKYYAILSAFYESRLKIYNRKKKIINFIFLLRKGAYVGKYSHVFGFYAMLKDFYSIILLKSDRGIR